ncbi:MAG: dihydroorotase [Pseudohongiellaceae bacterium]|jgi:dihydroorotase
MTNQSIRITQPDDWHLHLRDGTALATTVAHTAARFARAIVMPNLKPPITTVAAARDYRLRILDAVPQGLTFDPLMTLYLTDQLSPMEITAARESELVIAVKYYPAGATTNSDSGVTEISKVYSVIEKMIDEDMPLLIHGEVTDHEIDIFDREQCFIDQVLAPLTQRYPELRVVLEHITTKNAVDFVKSQKSNIAATITVHHLLYNRNDLLAEGVRPHFYCLPILKRNIHQQALLSAATSGSAQFFLGTDSAPHEKHLKESDCGCAGIYSAPAAIELYTEVFESQNALDKLEGFASFFGPDFYGLPRNTETIKLIKTPWTMDQNFQFEDSSVIPIRAGETINWQLSKDS